MLPIRGVVDKRCCRQGVANTGCCTQEVLQTRCCWQEVLLTNKCCRQEVSQTRCVADKVCCRQSVLLTRGVVIPGSLAVTDPSQLLQLLQDQVSTSVLCCGLKSERFSQSDFQCSITWTGSPQDELHMYAIFFHISSKHKSLNYKSLSFTVSVTTSKSNYLINFSMTIY